MTFLKKTTLVTTMAKASRKKKPATSGKPVDEIMAGFTEQSGAPLVSVTSSCNGNATKVSVSQERYFSDAKMLGAGSSELWEVPLNLRTAGSKQTKYVLLTERQQTFDLPGCASWVYA